MLTFILGVVAGVVLVLGIIGYQLWKEPSIPNFLPW